MSTWNPDGEWTAVPAEADLLADYLLAPEGKKPFPSKAALARELEVTPRRIWDVQKSKQFEKFLEYRRGLEGLDDQSMVERAKQELFHAGVEKGDTRALEQYLRMMGEFAPEKHEIVHTDVKDMTTAELEAEFEAILAKEKDQQR